MKLAIVFVALVGLVAAASFQKEKKIADKEFLEKQKFLFEIVYRVEDPLLFEEYYKFSDKLYYDKSKYSQFDYYMEKFYDAYKNGALLPKGEFFGALYKFHYEQAYGLFNFFYYAKDYETFKHNVAWARVHVNEGLFVYALTLAVIHRDDFEGLSLPAIYEIFPQYFFNSKFIYEAEKFDYKVFSKLANYEKQYKDVLYKDYSGFDFNDYESFYFYTKDWKTYQWWKLMGIDQHWYPEEKFLYRSNSEKFNKDSKFLDVFKDVDMFFYPVDYTREFGFYNEQTQLSYFTEDLGWNAFWYYFNLDYAFFLDGKTFGLDKDRRGEYYLYVIQQLLARYYLERLSHGFGEIPEFGFYQEYEYGYNPYLIAYNGAGFSYRKNYWEYEYYGNFEQYTKIYDFFHRINAILDVGYYVTADGKKFDFRKPESIEYIGNYLQGNVDTFDKYFFFSYWYLEAQTYFANAGSKDYSFAYDFDYEIFPSVFYNFETALRDPFFYSFHKKFTEVYYKFKYYLKPYTKEELYFPGVEFKNVEISDLYTYFDFTDFDVTNLLNDEIKFEGEKFVWDKTLLARQARLNHKPFFFDYTIESDKAQKVVIRSFFAPKFDKNGKTFSLSENRENFFQFDEFVYELKSGKNDFKRSSKDFYFTIEDRTTYTELYKYVMYAIEGKYEYSYDFSEPHCGFPDRLLLPYGTEKGFPLQFFFFVTPYKADFEQFSSYDYSYYCGIGSGVRHVDNYAFGYPFDRPIEEYEFFVPNMFFKDEKVYHEDKFEKYFEKQYEHFGKFDYSF